MSSFYKAILISVLYYIVGICIYVFVDLNPKHLGPLHGPGMNEFFMLLLFIIGLIWGFVSWMVYHLGKKSELLKGFYRTHCIVFIGFALFILVIINL